MPNKENEKNSKAMLIINRAGKKIKRWIASPTITGDRGAIHLAEEGLKHGYLDIFKGKAAAFRKILVNYLGHPVRSVRISAALWIMEDRKYFFKNDRTMYEKAKRILEKSFKGFSEDKLEIALWVVLEGRKYPEKALAIPFEAMEIAVKRYNELKRFSSKDNPVDLDKMNLKMKIARILLKGRSRSLWMDKHTKEAELRETLKDGMNSLFPGLETVSLTQVVSALGVLENEELFVDDAVALRDAKRLIILSLKQAENVEAGVWGALGAMTYFSEKFPQAASKAMAGAFKDLSNDLAVEFLGRSFSEGKNTKNPTIVIVAASKKEVEETVKAKLNTWLRDEKKVSSEDLQKASDGVMNSLEFSKIEGKPGFWRVTAAASKAMIASVEEWVAGIEEFIRTTNPEWNFEIKPREKQNQILEIDLINKEWDKPFFGYQAEKALSKAKKFIADLRVSPSLKEYLSQGAIISLEQNYDNYAHPILQLIIEHVPLKVKAIVEQIESFGQSEVSASVWQGLGAKGYRYYNKDNWNAFLTDTEEKDGGPKFIFVSRKNIQWLREKFTDWNGVGSITERRRILESYMRHSNEVAVHAMDFEGLGTVFVADDLVDFGVWPKQHEWSMIQQHRFSPVSSKALEAVGGKVKRVSNDAMGGIDLNAKNMVMDINGEKISIKFDAAMLAEFQRGDFSGVHPVIINITPIFDVRPMLGLGSRKEDEILAKV